MNAYVYRAALYCEECGERIRESLSASAPEDPDNEETYDSEDYPKGPYPDGGGEADSPQHCDECGAFLENPLTPEGIAWTHQATREKPDSADSKEWTAFYDLDDDDDDDKEEDKA